MWRFHNSGSGLAVVMAPVVHVRGLSYSACDISTRKGWCVCVCLHRHLPARPHLPRAHSWTPTGISTDTRRVMLPMRFVCYTVLDVAVRAGAIRETYLMATSFARRR